jgi:hypothetical protein
MKKFVKTLIFFFVFLIILFFVGVLLPATPRASRNFLFAKIHKDDLLVNAPSPRIIFIGGSNLSFGLDCQMIKDSLGLNPINTGINASLGLVYMTDNALSYIKSGDVVVVVPEYLQFYGKFAFGGEELLRTVMDISPKRIIELRKEQFANIAVFFPKYAFSKFKPTEYFGFSEDKIYSVSSYNNYGDVYTHWQMPQERFDVYPSAKEEFNHSVIEVLVDFKEQLQRKGAKLYISFPGFQATSFENIKPQIMEIENELKKKDFLLLGSAERYKMPDSMMFNTPYHLLKIGVDYRTRKLIIDIKNACHL